MLKVGGMVSTGWWKVYWVTNRAWLPTATRPRYSISFIFRRVTQMGSMRAHRWIYIPPSRRHRRFIMPKTSLHSVRHDAVPKDRVLAEAQTWAESLRRDHAEVVRVGCFGSYLRGD